MRKPAFKPAFKPSLQDTLRSNKSAMDYYAAMSGKPTPEGAVRDVKDKVNRGPRVAKDTKPESEVQSECIDFLVRHPEVVLVIRVNSGAVYTGNGGFVTFNHIFIPHRFKKTKIEKVKMRMSDLWVVLNKGKVCAIECKPEGWSHPCNEREHEQNNFLNHIRENGGIGFFAQSVNDIILNFERQGV